MAAFYVVLIALGVLLVLVLICAVALWWNRSGENPRYDERQLEEQRKAREVSDMVSMIYFIFVMCWLALAEMNGKETLKPYLLVWIGLVIQIMTYHIYCVMTHAALPFGQKPVATICWSTFAGLVQFGNYYTSHAGEPLITDQNQGVGVINLVAGVVFLAIALLHLITLLREEKE